MNGKRYWSCLIYFDVSVVTGLSWYIQIALVHSGQVPKNYRVKSKTFCRLLARLRTGDPTPKDATKITNLHLAYYEHNTEFIKYLKENHKSMLLYAKNMDKDKKNLEMLVHTSKHNNEPVARLDCCFGTNRISGQNEHTACRSHF